MIRLEDIVIPQMPALPSEPHPNDPQSSALLLNGRWYYVELSASQPTDVQKRIEDAARSMIYTQLVALNSYKERLDRVKVQLDEARSRLTASSIGMRVPNARQAASGLRVWQRDDNDFDFEMPLTYHPQYIKAYGTVRQLAAGQFRPIILSGVMRWNLAAKTAIGHSLYFLRTGERFSHYHTNGNHDCMGDLNIELKTYDEVIEHFWDWGQQLTIINADSIALKQPPEMPLYSDLKVLDGEREVAWTKETVSEEMSRSEVRATQPF